MANTKLLYNWMWPKNMTPLAIEMECVRKGGTWTWGKGNTSGKGLEFHFRAGLALCWPGLVFHKWFDDFIHQYLNNRLIGLMGPASTAKSHDGAICGLFDYYCFPTSTTGVYCTTTRELLQQRIWGEVVGLHKRAQALHPWLPGHLIESRLRIVTSDRDEGSEGRDFRNGLVGVPCKQGESWVGISAFVGIKNKRVRLFIDECSLLPKSIVDAISNLDSNADFKCVPMANPKDPTDAFGSLCEPAAEVGGWEGGIDQEPRSKMWPTKRTGGVCLQRVGTDSPNLEGKLGIQLITQAFIDRNVSFYGTDSLQHTMMDIGIMPRGQGSRRVLTRQAIEQYGAKLPPLWQNSNRTKIAMLDAAYRGVGGDRCILKFAEFGEEAGNDKDDQGVVLMSSLVTQPDPTKSKRQIFAITETLKVPISNKILNDPEEQIAAFCMSECIKRGVDPEHFFFDSGMRTALVQSFMRLWSVKVQSIDFGGSPSDRPVSHDIDVPCNRYYKKFVSELWFSVAWMVKSGQFRGMTGGEIEEFCSREWGLVGNNLTEVEPKADMKKKTGRSPDEADCVAVGVEGARRLGFIIRKLKPAKEPETDQRWRRDLREKSEKFWRSGQLTTA